MSQRLFLRSCAAAAIAAALAACGSRTSDDYGYGPAPVAAPPAPAPAPYYEPAPPADSGSNVDIDVNITNVVDVAPESYPDRTYWYEPSDTTHVYYYENSRPDVVLYRPIYRHDHHVYFIERDRHVVRRVYIDDHRARTYRWERDPRWDDRRRERVRSAAHEEWQRRERVERDWRSRWERTQRDGRRDNNDRRDKDRDGKR